jgi:potassium-dependent mechanosensitive channel
VNSPCDYSLIEPLPLSAHATFFNRVVHRPIEDLIPLTYLRSARSTIILLITLLLAVATTHAANAEFMDDQKALLDGITAKVELSRKAIAVPTIDDAKLALERTALDVLVKDALGVAVSFRPKLDEINKRLTDLGPVPGAGEAQETEIVRQERERLVREKSEINALLGVAEDLTVTIAKTADDIAERRRDMFADDLAKRVDMRTLLSAEVASAANAAFITFQKSIVSWFKFVTNFKLNSVMGATFSALLMALALFIAGRRAFGSLYSRDPANTAPTYLSRLSVAFWSTLIPSASVVFFLVVTYSLFDYFKVLRPDIREIIVGLFQLVAIVFFVSRLARAILSPDLPAWQLLQVDPKPARLLLYLATATAFVTGFDNFTNIVTDVQQSPLVLTIAKSFFASIVVGLLMIAISMVKPTQDPGRHVLHKNIRTVLFLLGLLPIIAALFGYVGLARFETQQIVITGAILVTMYLGFKSAQSLSGEGAFVKSNGGDFLRKRYAFGDVALDRIGVLSSIIVNILVVAIGLPLILLQWRFQWEDIKSWVVTALNGFTIGSVTISLVGVITGIITFFVIMMLTRWFQKWLDGNILSRGKIDSGVRHSIKTAFGYTGMGIALLIGISAAGIDLSSLALIAGALSLGIGFGLQNIVSNFVSGLILLAERPFKVGDWIVAGNTAGFVKKISVRATEIETFQHQTVIMPNSELINAAVGNWTHRNKIGRIEIAVGVSYASDPQQVHSILMEIGKAHPLVLKNPEPFVLFQAFADSSMNFELRVHLADITASPIVHNDVRFAIVQRFREAGIEIPFPQRDVHVRTAQSPVGLKELSEGIASAKITGRKRAKPIKI